VSYRQGRHASGEATPSLRPPPADLDIERQLLTAVLRDPSILPELLPQLDPKIFYAPSSVDLAKAIIKLHTAGDPVDLLTVSQVVSNVSAADLATWADNSIPSLWPSYLEILKNRAFARSLLAVLAKAQDGVYTTAVDPHDALAKLIDDLVGLQQMRTTKDFEPLCNVLTEAQKMIDRAYAGVTGIPTGFRDFDNRIGGIQPAELTIVAGRPGMGKTAFVQCLGLNAARAGYGVAFASLEMTAAQIGMRLISGDTGIENRNLRRGQLADRDFSRIAASATRLAALNISVLDSDRSWPRLKAKIRSLKLRQPDIALVLIDYVGLIDGETQSDRYLEIGMISAEAKELAKLLNVAVVLCSQLNRAVESRQDKWPQLSDLRESGNLEQDADLVLLLYRGTYYDANFAPADMAELFVAKNRQGPTGVVNLRFNPGTVTFSDWTDPPAPPYITQSRGAKEVV
jgi:replicative DNA helicase